MASQASSQEAPAELPLPPGFESIRSILDIENSRLDTQPLVNVIGLIRDYQPPTETRKTDWKCTITIIDLSTQEGPGIRLNLFCSRDKMPSISGAGDVMLVRKIKVQMFKGQISLLGNRISEFNVFRATKLPLWPLTSPSALTGAMTTKNRVPNNTEANYLVWLYHHIDTEQIPDAKSFQERAVQAMAKKEKYSLCKDLKADEYYDLLGEAIRVFDSGQSMTLHLSDYTSHPLFFRHEWNDGTSQAFRARDGDEYGYTKSLAKVDKNWPGPFGKMSIQITVFNDIDARWIREQVKEKDWISIRNVHARLSKSGCLEGVIHSDDDYPDRIHVEILQPPEDLELVDPRWKDAVRQKKQWWDKHEKQKKEYLGDIGGTTATKRKNGDNGESKQNSKHRRKAKLANAQQKLLAADSKGTRQRETGQEATQAVDLNVHIKCNHPQLQPTPLPDILDPKRNVIQLEGGQDYVIPFLNAKYRSNIRVVDFWPHRLEDFAVGRRVSEYDLLSDNSGGESTDNEEDMKQFRAGRGFGVEKKWEWRFALQVEDAGMKATSPAERMWLLVDHKSAQMLLNVDEAMNLRKDEVALQELREVLFTLWGDLEEKKTAFLKTPQGRALRWASTTSDRESDAEPEPPKVKLKPLDQPPPTSDDDENSPKHTTATDQSASQRTALADRDPNGSASIASIKKLTPSQASEQLSAAVWALPVTNKPFTCCIKQYGVQVPEDAPEKADAGDGKRWARMFGLFGTLIV